MKNNNLFYLFLCFFFLLSYCQQAFSQCNANNYSWQVTTNGTTGSVVYTCSDNIVTVKITAPPSATLPTTFFLQADLKQNGLSTCPITYALLAGGNGAPSITVPTSGATVTNVSSGSIGIYWFYVTLPSGQTTTTLQYHVNIDCGITDGACISQSTNPQIPQTYKLKDAVSSTVPGSIIYSCESPAALIANYPQLTILGTPATVNGLKPGDHFFRTISIKNTGPVAYDLTQAGTRILLNASRDGNIGNQGAYIHVVKAGIDCDGTTGLSVAEEFSSAYFQSTPGSSGWGNKKDNYTINQYSIPATCLSGHVLFDKILGAGENFNIIEELAVDSPMCSTNINSAYSANLNCANDTTNICQYSNLVNLAALGSIAHPNINFCFNKTINNCYGATNTENYTMNLFNKGNDAADSVEVYFFQSPATTGYTAYNFSCSTTTINVPSPPSTPTGDDIADQIISAYGLPSGSSITKIALPAIAPSTTVSCTSNTASDSLRIIQWQAHTICPPDTCMNKVKDNWRCMVHYFKGHCDMMPRFAHGSSKDSLFYSTYVNGSGSDPNDQTKLNSSITYNGPAIVFGANDTACHNAGNMSNIAEFTFPADIFIKSWKSTAPNQAIDIVIKLGNCINLYNSEYNSGYPVAHYDSLIKSDIQLLYNGGIVMGGGTYTDLMNFPGVTYSYTGTTNHPVNGAIDEITLHIPFPYSSTVDFAKLLHHVRLKINFQPHCCCGSGNAINFDVYHTTDATCATPCRLKVICAGQNITVTCPGCLRKGIHNSVCSVKRVNYGQVDANDDELSDTNPGTQASSTTPNVETHSVTYHDRFRVKQSTIVEIANYGPLGSIADCTDCIDSADMSQLDASNNIIGFKYGYFRTIFKGYGNFFSRASNLTITFTNPSSPCYGTPITLTFTPGLDFVHHYGTTLEVYYNISAARIDTAGCSSFDLFKQGTAIDFEHDFIVSTNPPVAEAQAYVMNKAYLGLKPEDGSNPSTWLIDPDAFDPSFTNKVINGTNTLFDDEPDYDAFCNYIHNNPDSFIVGNDSYDYITGENDTINSLCDIAWYCNDNNADFLNIMGIDFAPYPSHAFIDAVKNPCVTTFQLYGNSNNSNRFYLSNNSNAFSYEYRYWNRLEKIQISGLPAGLVIPSMEILTNSYTGTPAHTWKPSAFTPITTTTSPTLINFSNWYCPGPSSQLTIDSLLQSEDANDVRWVQIPFSINCFLFNRDTTYAMTTEMFEHFENGLDSGLAACGSCVTTIPGSERKYTYTNSFKINIPKLDISAPTAIGNRGQACWDINVQNINDVSAPNFWFSINTNGSSVNTASASAQVSFNNGLSWTTASIPAISGISGTTKGFYVNLGATPYKLLPATAIRIRICADYNCHFLSDTVIFRAGWNCSPVDSMNDILSACGFVEKELHLETYQPDMIVTDATNLYGLGTCDTLHCKYIISNSNNYLQNVNLTTIVPASSAYQLIGGSFVTTYGANTHNDTWAGTGSHNFNLSGYSTLMPDTVTTMNALGDFTGVLPGFGTGLSNTVSIEFDLAVGCGFTYADSGYVTLLFSGYNGCDTLRDSIKTNPLIESPTSPYNYLHFGVHNDTAKCTTITLSIENYNFGADSSVTGAYNMVTIDLPPGVQIQGGQITVTPTSSPSTTITATCSGSSCSFFIPSGISLSSIPAFLFSFAVQAVPASNVLQGDYPFHFSLFTNDAAFSCNGVACPVMELQDSVTIKIHIDTITISQVQTNPSCYHATNGSIAITASGYSPYAISLNGATPTTFTSLPAIVTGLGSGTYTISLTDGNGCPAVSLVQLVDPPALLATVTQTNASCFGGANGAITITAINGLPSYIINVSSSAGTTTDTFSTIPYSLTGLSQGTYTLIINDSIGCSDTVIINITSPIAGVQASATHTSVTCTGGKANITITATGGTPGYTYQYQVVNTSTLLSSATNIISGLNAGIYKITITDSVGCTKTIFDTIPVSNICGAVNVCKNAQENYSVSPYANATNYVWNCPGAIPATTTGTSNTVSLVWNSVGTHIITVTIKDIGGNTLAVQTLSVKVHAYPNPIVQPLTAVAGCLLTNPDGSDTCWVYCDSSIVQFTTTAVPGYTYYWDSTSTQILSGQGTNTVTVLYNQTGQTSISLTTTDTLAGCQSTFTKCVTIIEKPKAIIRSSAYAINNTVHLCLHQSIVLTDSSTCSSTSPINSYSWYDGQGNNQLNITPPYSQVTFTYHQPGIFYDTLIVQNTCGCSDMAILTVIVDSIIGPDIFCATTVCYGDTATYSTSVLGCANYNWSVSPEGTIVSAVNSPSIQVVWNNSVSATSGTVSLSVSSCSGYVCSDTSVVTIPILPPQAPITGSTVVCPGQLNMYSVTNIPGTIYTWSVTGNATLVSSATSPFVWIQAAAVGHYTVTVNYSNCTIACTGSNSLNVNIGQLFAIQCLTNSISCDKSCANEKDTLTSNSPSSIFNWKVYKATTPTNVLANAWGSNSFPIDWAILLTGSNAISTATKFIITATDTLNVFCNNNGTASFTITVYPPPVKPLSSAVNPFGCICPGAAISLMAQPSLPDYYLNWNVVSGAALPTNGAGNQFDIKTLGGLGTTYTLTLQQIMKDLPHCASDTMQLHINTCPIPTGFIHGDSLVCLNSSSTLTAPVGYDYYEWKMVNNTDGTIIAGQQTNTVTIQWNAPTGGTAYTSHNIEVAVKFCGTPAGYLQYIVNLIAPGGLSITASANPVCTGSPVSFTADTIGATPCGLTGLFFWDFGDGTTATSATNTSPAHIYTTPGSKTISVVAQNNTSSHILQSASVAVTVLTGVNVAAQISSGGCPLFTYSSNIVSGTAPPYTYQWLYSSSSSGFAAITGATNPNYTVAVPFVAGSTTYTTAPGYYQVAVTDNNGCMATATLHDACGGMSTAASCPNIYFGSISAALTPCTGQVTISSAVSPLFANYTINYGDGSTGTSWTHTYTKTGTYHITLTINFANGGSTCSNYFNTTVTVPILTQAGVNFSCHYSTTDTARIYDLTQAITSPITYSAWSISPSITMFQSGSMVIVPNPTAGTAYTLTYTATAGGTSCPATISFTPPAMPTALFTTPPSPVCEGTTVQFLDNSFSNIIGWDWDFYDGGAQNITSNLASPYEAFNFDPISIPQGLVLIQPLLVTDNHLCQNSTTGNYSVYQNTLGNVNLSVTGPNCFGTTDTIIAITNAITGAFLNYNLSDTLIQCFGGGSPPIPILANSGLATPTTQFSVTNPGNYYVTVTDGHGCSTTSTNGVNASFITTPPVAITGAASVCYATAQDYGMFVGNAYTYQWSISPAVSGTGWATPNLHINANQLSVGIYTLIGTISQPGSPACPTTDTLFIKVHPLPMAASIYTTPAHPCWATNSTVVLHGGVALATTPPYTYSWANGSNADSLVINSPGYYNYYITDSFGCQSAFQPSITVLPPPDFSTLITGCFESCDSFIVCPAVDPNYPHATWFLNGSPAPSTMVLSSGNLNPTQSGVYTLQLCNGFGCCAMSPPININILNCSNCCFNDTMFIDTMYCAGIDTITGNPIYQFVLYYQNNCPFNDSLILASGLGSITLQSSNIIVPGWNSVLGTYIPYTASDTTFCPGAVLYHFDSHTNQYYAICESYVTCYTMPDCNAYISCNYGFKLLGQGCIGFDPVTHHPLYKLNVDIVNPNGTVVPFTITTPQGNLVSGGSGTLASGSNNLTLIFDDTPPFDGYICLILYINDPVLGPCQQQLCFPLNMCMTPTKCIVEAWVTSISCAGYDALGNPQYTVTMNYINALGTLVNVLTSITSPFGTISNLTPTVPTTTGLNSLSFTFTDYALTGQGCFGIMLMDTIGGKYCYSDFTQLPKLCCVLPTGCPRMANPNQNNTVRPNPLSSGEGRGEVCAVKVVPNPNQGKTYIYYKVGYEQNNNLQQVYEQLQIVIIESGSGKKVYQQALPSQVGMVWLNDKPLAEGHYIVILSNNNTQLCNTKMEVVK